MGGGGAALLGQSDPPFTQVLDRVSCTLFNFPGEGFDDLVTHEKLHLSTQLWFGVCIAAGPVNQKVPLAKNESTPMDK